MKGLQHALISLLFVWAGASAATAALDSAPISTESLEVAAGLTVGVWRLAATADAPAGAAPIYFIAGGPGVSATEELERRAVLFSRLRRLGEVVLVEQRGAGTSRPQMDCRTRAALPLDRVPSRAEAVADARRQIADCAAELRRRGVDLTAYRTEAYAADVLTVMRHLGHERIRLVAHSYGTMIALELLRQQAKQVERAVLAGVMGPGDALRDPAHHERVLATFAAEQGLDAIRLRAQVGAVLDQTERRPLAASTSVGQVVMLGRDDIARGLLQTLGRSERAKVLPRVIESLAADLSNATLREWLVEVADAAYRMRAGALARRAAAQHLLTVCANGETAERRRARTAPSLFGHQLHATLPEACEAWGLPPAAARAPVEADTTVLLISALLDVRTPHEQALAAQRTLPRAVLMTLAGAGHGELLGPHPALDVKLAAFLRGEMVHAATFAPAPAYDSGHMR